MVNVFANPVDYQKKLKTKTIDSIEIAYEILKNDWIEYLVGRTKTDKGPYAPIIIQRLERNDGTVVKRFWNVVEKGRVEVLGKTFDEKGIDGYLKRIVDGLLYDTLMGRIMNLDRIKKLLKI